MSKKPLLESGHNYSEILRRNLCHKIPLTIKFTPFYTLASTHIVQGMPVLFQHENKVVETYFKSSYNNHCCSSIGSHSFSHSSVHSRNSHIILDTEQVPEK